jgi:hypothetical protein
LLDAELEADDDLLWRMAGCRCRALRSGRSSMFSAGSMAMRGTRCLELELERLRDSDGDGDVDRESLLLLLTLKKDGKSAWAICIERTEDMVMVGVGLMSVMETVW